MNFQELCNIKPEAFVEMAIPLFLGNCQQLAIEFTKAEMKDYTKTEWWLITEPTRAFTFDKATYMITVVDAIDDFMMGQKKLYYFRELPPAGSLVASKPKFWVFFNVQDATEYFRRQDQKPANFKKEELRLFPRFPVAKVLGLLLNYIMKFHKGLRAKAKEIPRMISFAKQALEAEEFKAFESLCKKSLGLELYEEVCLLKTHNAEGRDLEPERMKLAYDILLAFYIQDPVEKEFIEKLRSQDRSERQKAFGLAEKRLERYKG